MQFPWSVRPRAKRGDDTPDAIFVQVGRALTLWETLESRMAELFDALVSVPPSNRAAFSAFISVKSSSARTELIQAAFNRAMQDDDPAHSEVAYAIEAFRNFGARRNEIAHGRVYNLAEHGHMLGPNNVMSHKWTTKGEAKYQYTAKDIDFYASCFNELAESCESLAKALISRSASKTDRTSSSQQRRGKRT
jgi:hypothetical protein